MKRRRRSVRKRNRQRHGGSCETTETITIKGAGLRSRVGAYRPARDGPLVKCESDKAREKKDKTGHGHGEETVRREFFAHGAPPIASPTKQNVDPPRNAGRETRRNKGGSWAEAGPRRGSY
jgi:hypothetical protein